MKIQYLSLSTLILCGSIITGCATQSKAPISAEAGPQAEIYRASAAIEDASRKQFDRLSPNNFKRAVDYRNSATEKYSKGVDSAKVLNDVSISLQASNEVQKVGEANSTTMRSVLVARQFAMDAQAPKFQEKQFKSADRDLANFGEKMEKGEFKLNAEKLAGLEKKFGLSEIAARKHIELGDIKGQIETAIENDAKSKTPILLENARSKMAAAEQAIQMSPHNPEGYTTAIITARQSAQKLSDVLAISRSNGSNEAVATTIWNQNRALEASQTALSQAKIDSETKRLETKDLSDNVLAKSKEKAAVEKDQMENVLAAKDTRLDQQQDSIAALKSENNEYANEEELKLKIDEIKKTFSPDEAEVMKDGKKLVVRLKKMQFSSGRSELNPDSFETLRKVDELISAVPVMQVIVEGHTDSLGTDQKNKSLSQERAEAVKKYLLSQGLSDSLKVATAGYGSERPLTSNKTKGGRAINRRVDIVIETPVTL